MRPARGDTMRQITVTAKEIGGFLKGLLTGGQGQDVDVPEPTVQNWHTEGPGKKGLNFFRIAYEAGEEIVPRDASNDYALLLPSGVVGEVDLPDKPSLHG